MTNDDSTCLSPLYGNAGRLVTKAKLSKSTIFLVCATVVLASCTTYKARLTQESEPRSRAENIPSPTVYEKLIEGGENITGWVRLRFDVSATGEVRGVQIIGSSDKRLSEKAAAMMASWSFQPGTIEGKPMKFRDIEFMMTFREESTEISEAHVAVVIATAVFVALFIYAQLEHNCGVVTKC